MRQALMRSLRLRFAVLAAVLVASVVAMLGAAIYVGLERQLADQVDSRLMGRSSAIRDVRPFGPSGPGPEVILGPGRRTDGLFYLGVDSAGHTVFRTENAGAADLQLPQDVVRRALDGGELLVTVDTGGQSYRLDVSRAPDSLQEAVGLSQPDNLAVQSGLVLAAGQSLRSISDTLDPLRAFLLVAVLGGLILGGAGGLLVGRRALLPLTRLSTAVGEVGTDGDLSRRVPPPLGHDEVASLALAFNASLDRIEGAYRELEELLQRQRRFVADASHELRTPLTVIRADVGLLSKYPAMPDDDRAALVVRCQAEVERMTRLTNELLDQARSEAEALAGGGERLDWDEVVAAAVADVRALVAPRAVDVRSDPIEPGWGDGEVLRRIARIMAENVAHHTPPDTAVRVVVRRSGDAVEVAVGDNGPGVTDAFLPVMFDRFSRADRSRTVPGSGLGLAIAAALARGCGGSLVAAHNHPGLLLTVTVPIGPAAPAVHPDAPAAPPAGP